MVYVFNVFWVDGIGVVLNGFSDFDFGIMVIFCEYFEIVISGRVVGGGYCYIVGIVEVLNGLYDYWGWSRLVDDFYDDVVIGEYFCCLLSEFWGKEVLVVFDDDRVMFLIFVVYMVGKCLSDLFNI